MNEGKIKIGVSACLLGHEVRYNGTHKKLELLTEVLAPLFEYVTTCPELGAGMGVPRLPIRLVGNAANPKAVGVDNPNNDFTEDLQRYAQERIPQLDDLCGYVFIKNSPSCGLHRVKVYDDKGMPQTQGRGLFAAAVTKAYPLLPVEEDGRLHDPVLRENFLTRVYALHEWRQLCKSGLNAAALTAFHARFKYTLMAHAPGDHAELGRMLADAGKHDPQELGQRYFASMMQLLQRKATRKTNTNVLMHLQGYLKKWLQPQEKQSFTQVIERYRQGTVPLIVPITLLKHYFSLFPDHYIAQQAYLHLYPESLGLRNAL